MGNWDEPHSSFKEEKATNGKKYVMAHHGVIVKKNNIETLPRVLSRTPRLATPQTSGRGNLLRPLTLVALMVPRPPIPVAPREAAAAAASTACGLDHVSRIGNHHTLPSY